MRRQKGFTLIELLIVVAIIGIIAAIAIPNLLNAINRGRQKRTMADIRSIATAVESYQVDWNFYPKGATALSNLNGLVTPTYIKRVPDKDGWNQNMGFVSDGQGTAYTVWSTAKAGGDAGGSPTIAGTGGPKTDFIDDIIFVDGRYYQWPEGMQVN